MLILYVRGVSEQVRKVMIGYGVKVYFKPTNTLKPPKDLVMNVWKMGP